jgi:hypothetical protein
MEKLNAFHYFNFTPQKFPKQYGNGEVLTECLNYFNELRCALDALMQSHMMMMIDLTEVKVTIKNRMISSF